MSMATIKRWIGPKKAVAAKKAVAKRTSARHHDTGPKEAEPAIVVKDAEGKVVNDKKAAMLANALNQFDMAYPVQAYEPCPICIPGIGDVFLRQVVRLGYKGEYPRPYDWENLIPQLREGEELLWIIRKRGGQDCDTVSKEVGDVVPYAFEVYIGLKFTDDAPQTKEDWENRQRRFAALTRHFAKSAFPETLLKNTCNDRESAEFLNDIVQMEHVRIVTGMPSIKDADLKEVSAKRVEEVRPYSGLNDFLEMHGYPEANFAIVFSVARVSDGEIHYNFDALFSILNVIQPMLKEVVQYSESKSEGWSITNTDSWNESSIDKVNGGERQFKRQRGLFPRMGRGIMNFMRWCGGTSGDKEKEFDNQKYVKEIGVQQSHAKGGSRAESKNGSHQSGKTWSVTKVNSMLAFKEERIKESLTQLTQTLGTGGYSCGAAVYADSSFTVESLAGAICATMSGGHSALHPMRVHELAEEKNHDWLVRRKSLAKVMSEDGIQSGILNCDKACQYLPVPTTHLVGLPLKKNVFYGKERSDSEADWQSGIHIGSMAFAEAHIANEHARFLSGLDNHLMIKLAPEDFFSHIFIVGTTGCGKTTRAAKILHDADCFRKVILETAKKTYWNELGLKPDEVVIYTLGDSTRNPLRFNPFFFEKGTNLKQHIAVLADAISDLLPMEALIGPKLREAVERCYQMCGWDVETSERDDACNAPEYPDVAMFNLMVRRVAEEMSDYSAEVQGNYKGALLNRSAIFMDAVYQDIFAFDGNKTVDELFPTDKTVIIEMEEMPPSEINMPAFIISLLLQRIRAYQNAASRNGTLKDSPGFLIAIEEAHNVLSRDIQAKQEESQSGKGGHLVKQVTRLLAEGRGLKLGLMIIDQSAANIAPSVIVNTNTKLVFRQEDGTEIETIGKAIGLTEETWGDLQLLERGEYLLRNGRYPQPVKMAPLSDGELLRDSGLSRDDFVPLARWVPPYGKMHSILRQFCIRDGIRTENNEAYFDGYRGDAYDKIVVDLKNMSTSSDNDGANVFHDDLLRYAKIKSLLEFKYYMNCEVELGVASI